MSRQRHRSGLTLLECIVVLVVVMIVVAISLPSLYHASNSGKSARSLGQIKQHATAITAYVLSSADSFPTLVPAGELEADVPDSDGNGSSRVLYFGQSAIWHWAVYPEHGRLHPAHRSPFARESWGYMTHYQMPCAFLAEPAYWDLSTRVGPEQWRPMRMLDCRFPDRKVLLIDFPGFFPDVDEPLGTPGRRSRAPVALVDGSASLAHRTEFAPGVETGEGFGVGPHSFDWLPGFRTIRGVAGSDLP